MPVQEALQEQQKVKEQPISFVKVERVEKNKETLLQKDNEKDNADIVPVLLDQGNQTNTANSEISDDDHAIKVKKYNEKVDKWTGLPEVDLEPYEQRVFQALMNQHS